MGYFHLSQLFVCVTLGNWASAGSWVSQPRRVSGRWEGRWELAILFVAAVFVAASFEVDGETPRTGRHNRRLPLFFPVFKTAVVLVYKEGSKQKKKLVRNLCFPR